MCLPGSSENIYFQVNLNSAFACIYDENYSGAIEYFKKVVKQKPPSLIASNNLAVCSIFINQTQKAIDTLTDLIKSNGKMNITEQVVNNLMAFYEVHYPTSETKDPNEIAARNTDPRRRL